MLPPAYIGRVFLYSKSDVLFFIPQINYTQTKNLKTGEIMKKEQIFYKMLIVFLCISNQNMTSTGYFNQTDFIIKLPEYTTLQTKEDAHGTTIAYFNEQGNNIALQATDQHNNTLWIIIFHLDGSQTKTTYNVDKTKTTETFGPNKKISSKTEYNKQGDIICFTNFNIDNSQTNTTYNLDATKTVNYFDKQGNNFKRVEINKQGNPTETIELYDDGTFAKIIHKIDKTQTKQHFNSQGQPISTTEINPFGSQMTAQAKLLTAWHEAGHCLSYIHNQSLNLIQHVTIKPDTATKSQGHVQSVRTYNVERTIEQLENDIISALCGGVGEQVLLGQKMLTDQKEILNYYDQQRFASDIELARKDAREIIACDWINFSEHQILQKIDTLLVKLYVRAYQFIYSHQNDMKKIADKLMLQEALSSDETYDLVNAEKPLMSYEEYFYIKN